MRRYQLPWLLPAAPARADRIGNGGDAVGCTDAQGRTTVRSFE